MRPRLPWIIAGALAPALVSAGPAAPDIEHTALACVPIGRYARVAARSAAGAAGADLQFRGDPGGGWYSVRMAAEEDGWTGFLPRPTSAVRSIEYRIVVHFTDATSATSRALSVPVLETCDTDARASVASPIVIRVPGGAPAVPPVPAGFAPAGVVLAEEKRGLSRSLKIGGAVAAATVLGATAVAVAGATAPPEPHPIVLPELRFNAIVPVPGSTLVRGREGLAVSMVMSHQPTFPLTLSWRVELVSTSAGRTCVQMDGHLFEVQSPIELTLAAPVVSSPGGDCGPQGFDTDSVRITVAHENQIIHDMSYAFGYRFVP